MIKISHLLPIIYTFCISIGFLLDFIFDTVWFSSFQGLVYYLTFLSFDFWVYLMMIILEILETHLGESWTHHLSLGLTIFYKK